MMFTEAAARLMIAPPPYNTLNDVSAAVPRRRFIIQRLHRTLTNFARDLCYQFIPPLPPLFIFNIVFSRENILL